MSTAVHIALRIDHYRAEIIDVNSAVYLIVLLLLNASFLRNLNFKRKKNFVICVLVDRNVWVDLDVEHSVSL